MKYETTITNFEHFIQKNYKKIMGEIHNRQIPLETSGSASDEEISHYAKEIKNEIVKKEKWKTENRNGEKWSDILGKYKKL